MIITNKQTRKFEMEVKLVNDNKEGLLKYIENSDDIEEILSNLCNELQKITSKVLKIKPLN